MWVYKRGKPLGEEGLLEFIRENGSLDKVVLSESLYGVRFIPCS